MAIVHDLAEAQCVLHHLVLFASLRLLQSRRYHSGRGRTSTRQTPARTTGDGHVSERDARRRWQSEREGALPITLGCKLARKVSREELVDASQEYEARETPESKLVKVCLVYAIVC